MIERKDRHMEGFDLTNAGFDTTFIHAGQRRDSDWGALATPIYQTSTFCYDTVEEGQKKIMREIPGCYYSRSGNPTNFVLEEKIAAIEGAEAAVSTASGLGAIGCVMVAFLRTGDHVVCGQCVYGGTNHIMGTNLAQFGIDVTFVDTTKPEEVEAAVRPNTKMLYFETVANPLMTVTDVAAMSKIAKSHGLKMVVDSTFTPPPILFALELGADIVIHSLTKYYNGHGDVIGGVAAGSKEDMDKVRNGAMTRFCGTALAPFNAYLVIRSMKTMGMRVRRHCANAMEVARYLEASPFVERVYYAGLESHPQHELAKRQMREALYTGMIAFELKDGVKGLSAYDAGTKLLNSLRLAQIAVSLGDPDTLIEHPASMTHARVSKEDKEKAGISDGLIRLSVGLEDTKDIIRDFEQAFAAL